MASPEFFATCGLFVEREGFAPARCAALSTEARAAHAERARVYLGREFTVDEHTRRSAVAEMSVASQATVDAMLSALQPRLSAHFKIALTARQPTEFLVYHPGDFFERHEDGGAAADPDSPELVKRRRVSVVLFLNDDFAGGALTLYGLLDDPRARDLGFPLQPEAGLVVAFRAQTPHEVMPVTSGDRVSVVTFFE